MFLVISRPFSLGKQVELISQPILNTVFGIALQPEFTPIAPPLALMGPLRNILAQGAYTAFNITNEWIQGDYRFNEAMASDYFMELSNGMLIKLSGRHRKFMVYIRKIDVQITYDPNVEMDLHRLLLRQNTQDTNDFVFFDHLFELMSSGETKSQLRSEKRRIVLAFYRLHQRIGTALYQFINQPGLVYTPPMIEESDVFREFAHIIARNNTTNQALGKRTRMRTKKRTRCSK